MAAATLAFASRRVGFLLYAFSGDRGRLYETHDGGRVWGSAPESHASGLIAADGTVYVYDRRQIFVATTSGSVRRLVGGLGPTMVVVDGVLYDYDGISKYPKGGRSVLSIQNGRVTRRWRMPCTKFDFASVLTGLADGTLIDVCASEGGTGTQIHRAHYSTDGGRDWRRSGSLGESGYIDWGASGSAGAFLGEGRGNLLVEYKPGGRWAATPVDSEDEGVTELGFWSSRQGWATTQGSPHGLWLTDDGGRHWRAATNP